MLEKTDSAPRGANGTRDESRVAEDTAGEFVQGGDWGPVEGFVGGDGENEEYGCEEAGEAGEDSDPVGDVGTETGWVGRVKDGTG